MVAVIPDKAIAILSLAVNVVEVQFVKLVEEASTAVDNAGFTPLPPTMLVTGNPAPSAALKISTVIEPLGEPIKSHPCNVPPYGILIGFVVMAVNACPPPSANNVKL